MKNLTHNAKDFLSVAKSDYKQWVFRYTFLELEKDLGVNGDITTDATTRGDVFGNGVIVAEEDGILAGVAEIRYFLIESDPRFKPRISELQVEFYKKDGEKIVKGDKILKITGKVKDILALERVVLNLMMRMSGVASFTNRLVTMIREKGFHTLLTPTRKTLWGLLDKKAVSVGGGGTHRLNLSDAVLIKDNHLALLGGSITTAIKNVSENASNGVSTGRFVEVEVESAEDALKAAEAFASVDLQSPACILFDNMPVAEIVKALNIIKEKGYYDKVLFEASGGITPDNLVEYAETGVDIISMGALTNSAKSLEFSCDVTG